VPWASDYPRFTRRELTEKSLYWASAIGTFIALIWLAVLGAAMASSWTGRDPAELVASLFGVMTIPALLVIIHGAVAGNIQCVYSAPLCFLAGGIKIKRWLGSIITGLIASTALVGFLASTKFVTSFTNYMDSFVIWTAAWGVIVIIDFFILNRGRADVPALYASPATSRYGDIRWRSSPRCWSGWWRDGCSSTAGYRCSRVRSRAPPTEWTSRGWRRSCSAGRRIGCCAAPNHILSPRLRLPPGMAERAWPGRSFGHEPSVSMAR
jgi:purine-cytosine permease-like protein